MTNVLITGNSFDLRLGLPTRYSDFINITKGLQSLEGLSLKMYIL